MCCGVSCHHGQGTTRASWGPPRGNGQMPAVGRGQPRRDSMGCREGLHKLLFPSGRRALGAAGTRCRVHVKVWNGGTACSGPISGAGDGLEHVLRPVSGAETALEQGRNELRRLFGFVPFSDSTGQRHSRHERVKLTDHAVVELAELAGPLRAQRRETGEGATSRTIRSAAQDCPNGRYDPQSGGSLPFVRSRHRHRAVHRQRAARALQGGVVDVPARTRKTSTLSRSRLTSA